MTVAFDTHQPVNDLASKPEQAEIVVAIVCCSNREIVVKSGFSAPTAALTAGIETPQSALATATNRHHFLGALAVLFAALKYLPNLT